MSGERVLHHEEKIVAGQSIDGRRGVAPAAVEWRVLFDENPEHRDEALAGNVLAGETPRRSRAGQWALLLCLAALVAGYFLWEVEWAAASPPSSIPPERRVASADTLALAARDTVLTDYLRIDARGLDLTVATWQADEMDRLYRDTFARLGLRAEADLRAPDGRFFVSVQEAARIQWDEASGLIVLPSPTGQTGIAPLPQADLLGQSWRVVLGQRAVSSVAEAYAVPYGWLPLLSGLRLWLLWDGDGPLAVGQQRIVAWLGDPARKGLIVEEVADICRIFSYWRLSPLDYEIPIGCDQSGFLVPSAVPLPLRLRQLASIFPPRDSLDDQYTPSLPKSSKAVAIALALFYEYSIDAYGRDSLPRLLDQLDEHDDWDTLIPAVYGVSAQTFEAGWHLWLIDEYRVNPSQVNPSR